jgi:hypothetical protein
MTPAKQLNRNGKTSHPYSGKPLMKVQALNINGKEIV